MAGRIKGITIEFGGETVKLENAFKTINQSSKNVQNNLKDINKLLKFDPKNSDLLKQKQEALAKAIDTSKEKLNKLKEIERELAKDPGQKEKWEIVKREIAETENQLKSYKAQQIKLKEEMSAFHKVGEQVTKVGDGFERAGKKLLPVTAGITALSFASKKAWDEVDEMLDIVVTKTGETGDNLKELQGVAKEVFKSEVAPSAVDAGNAVGELNTRFGFTGDVLRDASIDFLKFAKVTGQDVNSAVINVSRAMGDAGIDAKDYKLVLDQLTVAGQKSGIEVGQLTETLTKFGAPMRQLGFDTKESIALFASWEKAGVNTEIAFSGLKKAIGNWAKEGKDAKVEFRKMLDEIQKAPTLADATTKAIEVFGQKAGPDLADAIKGGRFEFNEMTKALEKGGGTVETTFENTRDPIDKMKQAFNNIKVTGAELAQVAMQVLAPVFQNLANKAKALSDWFSKLTDKQKEMIVKILGIVGAVAPVLIILGKLTQGIGNTIDAFKKIHSAITKLSSIGSKLRGGVTKIFALVKAHPFIAIAVAIAALVAGLIYAYKHCEKFRNIVDKAFKVLAKTFESFMKVATKVWDVIKKAFQVAWNTVINPIIKWIGQKIQGLKEPFNKFKNGCINIFKSVWTIIKTVWDVFWAVFEPVFKVAWEVLSTVFKVVFTTISTIFKTTWEVIKTVWDVFWTAFEPIFKVAWEVLSTVFKVVLDTISTIFKTTWEVIKTAWDVFWTVFEPIFKVAWEVFKVVFQTTFNVIKTIFTTVWNSVKIVFETILGVIKGIWDIFAGIFTGDWNRVWEGMKGIFSSIWNGIKGLFGTLLNGMWDLAKSIFTGLVSSVKSIFGNIPGAISKIWDKAVNFLKNIDLVGIGKNIIQGLINGIGAMGDALWQAAKNIGKRFVSSIKSFFGINSPSRVMAGFGVNIGEGLVNGVDEMQEKVNESGKQISNAFTKGYEERQKNFKNKITGTYDLSANSNVLSKFNQAIQEFNNLKNNLNITVVSELDGKAIAKGTWKYTDGYQEMNMKRLRSVKA